MSSAIVYLFCFAVVLAGVQGQVIAPGSCPNATVEGNFDVGRYLGRWFAVQRFYNTFEVGNCSEANYGPVDEQGNVAVLNKEIVNNTIDLINGTARLVTDNGDAKLAVILQTANGPNEAPYWVLGTDYDDYALVWSCADVLGLNAQFSWILSRTRVLSQNATKAIDELVSKNGLNGSNYNKVHQENCSLLP